MFAPSWKLLAEQGRLYHQDIQCTSDWVELRDIKYSTNYVIFWVRLNINLVNAMVEIKIAKYPKKETEFEKEEHISMRFKTYNKFFISP